MVRARTFTFAGRPVYPSTAEELAPQVAAIFWRAWRADPNRFESEMPLATWIRLAVRTKLMDRIRSTRRRAGRDLRHDEILNQPIEPCRPHAR